MSGLGYMLPKDEQRLTERNYATHFLQWYTDLSNAVATLGIPQNALFYEGGTEPPYSKVVTKSVLFLSKQVECVPAAEVYGINADGTLKTPTLSQKKELFQLTAAYDTMKSRVTAAICHFTDPFMYAVYKQGAGNNEEIVAGMNALRSHCLVNNSANIDAAKNSLRALRLQPNEHPSQFLRNMKKRILELSELGYPSTTEADNFESENVRQFFAGMPTAEMQRSMKTLVASAKGKTDFTFRDIVDVMAEDERSIQQMNHHKEMFDKNTSKAFLSEAKNEAKFVTVDEFNNLATELAKALAAINKTSNNAAHPTANRTKDPLKVYVAGLPEGTTQAQLLGLFQTATEAFVVRNKTKNTTIGFVSFANPAAATLALSSVPELGGKKLTIQAAFNKAASHYVLPSPLIENRIDTDLKTVGDGCNNYKSIDQYSQINTVKAYLDSGSMKHMTNNATILNNTKSCIPSNIQGIAPGAVIRGSGMEGTVEIANCDSVIKEVEYIPDASESLISIWKILLSKQSVYFDHESLTAYIGTFEDGKFHVKYTAKGVDGLFELVLSQPTSKAFLGSVFPHNTTLRTWHERFMHAGVDQILKTVPAVRGLNISGSKDKDNFFCETCIMAKMPRLPYNNGGWESGKILHTVITDVFFPERSNPSVEGYTCMLGIMVPSINFKICYGLYNHSAREVTEKLIIGIKYLESVSNEKVQFLQMDPSGEAESNLMREACRILQTTIQISMTDAHNQDGHTNGYFKVMMERVRANIIQTGAPKNFWLGNALYHTYIDNRTVHGKETKTPIELLTGQKPLVSQWRTLNCIAYPRILPKHVKITVENETKPGVYWKIGPRATRATFVGVGNYDGHPVQRLGWKFMTDVKNPESIIYSRDAYFTENIFQTEQIPGRKHESLKVVRWAEQNNDKTEDDYIWIPTECPIEILEEAAADSTPIIPNPVPITTAPPTTNTPSTTSQSSPTQSNTSTHFFTPSEESETVQNPMYQLSRTQSDSEDDASPPPPPTPAPALRRSTRNSQPQQQYDASTGNWKAFITKPANISVRQALLDPKWIAAFDKHHKKLAEAKSYHFELISQAKAPIIPSFYSLTEKTDADTGITERKVRLVGNGKKQELEDVGQVYASTPDVETNKIFSIHVLQRGMSTIKTDIIGAYPNTPNDPNYPTYTTIPYGMPLPEGISPNTHCIFWDKICNGQRNGPFIFQEHRNKLFLEYGFEKCPSSPCLWMKQLSPVRNEKILLMQWFVDDGEVAADPGCENERTKFLNWFNSRLPLTIEDEVGTIIGCRKTYYQDAFEMDQEFYITNNCLPLMEDPLSSRKTPWDNRVNMKEFDDSKPPTAEESKEMETRDYSSAFGTILVLNKTRPDILFTLGKLGQHMKQPKPIHWKALQHLLGYLNRTSTKRLRYNKSSSIQLKGYSDSDLAADTESRKSRSGVVAWCPTDQNKADIMTKPLRSVKHERALLELGLVEPQKAHLKTFFTVFVPNNYVR